MILGSFFTSGDFYYLQSYYQWVSSYHTRLVHLTVIKTLRLFLKIGPPTPLTTWLIILYMSLEWTLEYQDKPLVLTTYINEHNTN